MPLLDMETPRVYPDDPEKSLKTLNIFLVKLIDNINECLCNLDEGNMTDGIFDKLKATTVVANTIISNTIITNNLYATYGDIIELTVDYLNTLNKAARYWAADTSDANFITARNQTIQGLTAQAVLAGGIPQTVQHTDRNGLPLYYNGPVTAETYKEVGMSTTPSAYPVMVYDYNEVVKLVIGHVLETRSGYMMPMFIMGAGSGTGDNGKGFIYKSTDGLYIDYYSATTGNLRRIVLGDDGIYLTPYALESINFYNNGFSAQYSGQVAAYTWEKDIDGKIIKLIDDEMNEIPITWNAGDM